MVWVTKHWLTDGVGCFQVPDVDVILNPLLSILNIPLHRLQRSITCKQNIEKTLATVRLCLSLCVSVWVSLSASLCHCLSLSASAISVSLVASFNCLSQSLYFSASLLSFSLCMFLLCVCVFVSFLVCLAEPLCLSVCLFMRRAEFFLAFCYSFGCFVLLVLPLQ